MYLFLVARWGSDQSDEGANGDDTVFLVRASDHEEAAGLVDPLLQELPHERTQPFSHCICQLGVDESALATSRVLLGPFYGFCYYDYPKCWGRDSLESRWTVSVADDEFDRATIQKWPDARPIEIPIDTARSLYAAMGAREFLGDGELSEDALHYTITFFYPSAMDPYEIKVHVTDNRTVYQAGTSLWELADAQQFTRILHFLTS